MKIFHMRTVTINSNTNKIFFFMVLITDCTGYFFYLFSVLKQ